MAGFDSGGLPDRADPHYTGCANRLEGAMVGTRYAWERHTKGRRRGAGAGLRLAVLTLVTALAAVSCAGAEASPEGSSSAAQTQPVQPARTATPASAQWPNCGQIRRGLQAKGYAFTHTSSHTWRAIKSEAFAIVISDDDSAVPGVSMSVYDAGYEKFQTDIDSVFRAIAPDALTWAHGALSQTKTVAVLATRMTASGGTVTVNWNKSEAVLSFVFTGK
jgi:hypothetical protein